MAAELGVSSTGDSVCTTCHASIELQGQTLLYTAGVCLECTGFLLCMFTHVDFTTQILYHLVDHLLLP